MFLPLKYFGAKTQKNILTIIISCFKNISNHTKNILTMQVYDLTNKKTYLFLKYSCFHNKVHECFICISTFKIGLESFQVKTLKYNYMFNAITFLIFS